MASHQKAHNEECTIARTKLFDEAPSQNEIISSTWHKINRIDGGQGSRTVKFKIEGTEQYIDLSSILLELHLKLTKLDGTNLDAGTNIAPTNLIGSSMFSQVKVSLKKTPVLTHPNYDIASFIQTECTFNNLAKKVFLALYRYHKDTAGELNTMGAANLGYEARKAIFSDSKVVEVFSQVNCSLFMTEKLLLNHLELEIEFDRQKDVKCVMAAAGTDFKLNIEKAILHVRKVNLAQESDLAIQNKLLKLPVHYDIQRYFIFAQTIAAGKRNVEIRNFNIGEELPTQILVVLVDESAYTGNLAQNPFNFKHFNVSSFDVLANGQSVYGSKVECDFTNNRYSLLYMHTMKSLGHWYSDGCDISLDDFSKGSTIFGADLTASQCSGDIYEDPIKTGSLEIMLEFSQPIPNTMSTIIYCDYNSSIQINANRDVSRDFTN